MFSTLSRLIGRLTVGRKLALIYFLDLTAVIFVSGILIHEKFIAIDFAKKELVGIRYITVVREALMAISPAEQLLAASGTVSVTSLSTLVNKMKGVEAELGEALESGQLSQSFVAALERLDMAQLQRQSAPASYHHDAFSIGRELLTRVGNQSNLILDPDLDSYYTMSLIVLRFPELLEVESNMHSLALKLMQMPAERRQQDQTRFLILEGRIDAIMKGIDSDYKEAFAASNPLLRQNLQRAQSDLGKSIERFRSASLVLAGLAEGKADANSLEALDAESMAALKAAWSSAEIELNRLLNARLDEAFNRMGVHLGTAALLLAVILSLVFFVARQIARPIRNLANVADRVRRSGNYQLRATWGSEDEIGRLVTGFNSMLEQLDRQRSVQEELVARASAMEAQRELVEAIPIPMMVTAIPRHEILHANEAARTWLKGREEDPWVVGMAPALKSRFFQTLSDLGKVDEFEVLWNGGDVPTWALVSARRLEYQGQAAVLTTFTPIGQMKQMESRLELWAKVFDASSESIVVLDQSGRIMTVNPAFSRSTAFEIHEMVGQLATSLLSSRNATNLYEIVRYTTVSKGSWQGEIWINRKNGDSYPAWLVMNAVRDRQGVITHYIAISLDITERKENEKRIHFLAHHDVLTGLPNRFLCMERLQLSLQQARRSGSIVGVLFIDLDRFKNINDSLGHHIGDGLLRSVAARLLDAVREGDTVCRLGGDEFVVILNGALNVEEIGKIVEQRLIPLIQKTHQVDGDELYISCSVGVAVYPDDGRDGDGLMRNADAAMYQAKKMGRNNVQFFTPELNARVVAHLHLESDLRHAVDRNELVLYYQPRIHAEDGTLSGVESLVRWQHPTEGLMLPANFIPVAEESGLIVSMGAWIIREACRQHVMWRASGLGEIPVSINLSALQMKDTNLIRTLKDVVAEFPICVGFIELELTESILMDNVTELICIMEQIKALGFLLSIDDFGTGYSSLNYLYRFPIDKLKIDKSFIQNIHSAPHHLAVTRAIIGLGHTLDLEVVAEGVEYEADVIVLREAGCDELQGFHFARPMACDQFENWLQMRRAESAEALMI